MTRAISRHLCLPRSWHLLGHENSGRSAATGWFPCLGRQLRACLKKLNRLGGRATSTVFAHDTDDTRVIKVGRKTLPTMPRASFDREIAVLEALQGEGVDMLQPYLSPTPGWLELSPQLVAPTIVMSTRLQTVVDHIEAIHNAGFVHWDVRLPNIMYNKVKQKAVLVDFGAARTTWT